uniref:putative pentatricopeptide repeat-containing protein At1g12700, mitochondrial n=1 Tax=Erigeron canadensis TaxID=72917 RepID=UPI001CB992F7|nr:putative pentatricopeptide repeat-containing protein At1g12700, mitochondrial [Erigeron canadensis]
MRPRNLYGKVQTQREFNQEASCLRFRLIEMENLYQVLIKSSFKGNMTITNCFLGSSSSIRHLGRRFGPHPNYNIKWRHNSSSCSLDNTRNYDRVINLNDALESFDVMIRKRPLPSVVKFTRLLHDVTQLKHYACSLYLFKQLCALGVPVNTYTAGIAIKCYHRMYRTKYGLAVLGSCFKQGVELHVSTYNTLMRGFVLNNTHLAEYLFCGFITSNRLRELNLSSYKIMIKGLCKVGSNFTAIGLLRLLDHGILDGTFKYDLSIYNTIFDGLCNDVIFIDYAFKLWKEMVHHKAIPPNVDTYNSLIRNLCRLARWDEVCRILKEMEDAKISPKLRTFNIIVDALCKQGKIAEARAVIDIMVDETSGRKYPPNAVTYNPLIDFYCWTNEVSEARRIYDSMDSQGIEPDFFTYHMFYLRYFIDKDFEKFQAFPSVGSDLSSQLSYFILCRTGLGIPRFPEEELYHSLLMKLKYDSALALFHLMNRSGLNREVEVHRILMDRASKHKRFDEERRLYHVDLLNLDMFLNNLC